MACLFLSFFNLPMIWTKRVHFFHWPVLDALLIRIFTHLDAFFSNLFSNRDIEFFPDWEARIRTWQPSVDEWETGQLQQLLPPVEREPEGGEQVVELPRQPGVEHDGQEGVGEVWRWADIRQLSRTRW
jgi:hypothetical protein